MSLLSFKKYKKIEITKYYVSYSKMFLNISEGRSKYITYISILNYSTDMKIIEAMWANKLEPQGIMGIIILFRSLFYYSLRYRSDDMQALHFNFTWIIQMQHIGLGIEKKIGWLECANFYLRSLIVYYMPHLIVFQVIIIDQWLSYYVHGINSKCSFRNNNFLPTKV